MKTGKKIWKVPVISCLLCRRKVGSLARACSTEPVRLMLRWNTGYNFCFKRSFESWAAGSSCRHAEVSTWGCSLGIRSVQSQRDEKHRSPMMNLHLQARKHRWNSLDRSFLGRGLYIWLGLEDVFCIALLFVNISIHLVLRNNFKCESPFWNLYAQFHFCAPAACMSQCR